MVRLQASVQAPTRPAHLAGASKRSAETQRFTNLINTTRPYASHNGPRMETPTRISQTEQRNSGPGLPTQMFALGLGIHVCGKQRQPVPCVIGMFEDVDGGAGQHCSKLKANRLDGRGVWRGHREGAHVCQGACNTRYWPVGQVGVALRQHQRNEEHRQMPRWELGG
ncbi:hypothetical protein GGTG_04959 [Gaeumannomyces tritici R3-111a-1]|uniref:Uncharacterized protein n=1 Tax=Gaeumannomyces tritici (strain R3-111a-1) TaxID=644352 RepID=J3NUK3_GAET3|nr:hypothetical protein GGTG_04959 [Gaeumannomyces tritici R3-111a-1]EJT79876.1 hypothetical protein GGTG_04959 [Gaeumannomyces tritici R3-111a-1]